jgi:hypothetical protein
MELRRYVGLVDLGILTVVLVAVVMPPREMYASAAMKGSEAERLAVALAEARTIAQPKDASRVDELAHQLGEAGFKDWAVEAGIDGSERTRGEPEQWRALLAASVAYIDRLEAKPALKYALEAFAACKQVGDAACPTWERTRMEIYKEHLSAGVEANIDPKKDPKKFREAGEGRIRTIRIGGGNR